MLIQLFCFVLPVYIGTRIPPEREATFLDKSVHRFGNLDAAYFLSPHSLLGNSHSGMTSLTRIVTRESMTELFVNVAPNTVLSISK